MTDKDTIVVRRQGRQYLSQRMASSNHLTSPSVTFFLSQFAIIIVTLLVLVSGQFHYTIYVKMHFDVFSILAAALFTIRPKAADDAISNIGIEWHVIKSPSPTIDSYFAWVGNDE